MATIVPIETKPNAYAIALATGSGNEDKLQTADQALGARNGISDPEIRIVLLEPESTNGDRLIIVFNRYHF